MVFSQGYLRENIIVPQVEELIGYKFNNKKYCWEALQAKGTNGYLLGNKRLALLGDAILRYRLIKAWYPTGSSTEACQNMVSKSVLNTRLGILGKQIGLDNFICTNPSQKGNVQDSQVADAMEALVGAVDEDGGEKALDVVMARLGVVSSSISK
ncbi:hypothetical protein G7Y89_g7000 [Cudoniella acicularis]|uniref:RNase III domain-containing protein n=1 Tax=Cudoniella acicularis TaxID=354080 RepID=A0A8H4RMV5_9HELO|nr:hypothetical protein G7Y89_g7000 [Cudoniella acicularis]